MISYGYHHLVPIDIDTNKTYMKEMIKMDSFVGACRFCGQVQTIVAGRQEEADEIATLNCNCDDAEAYRRRKDLMTLIDSTCQDLPEDCGFVNMSVGQIKALRDLGGMVADGFVMKATVDIADSRCMINRKKDGSFTFRRNKVLCLGGDI